MPERLQHERVPVAAGGGSNVGGPQRLVDVSKLQDRGATLNSRRVTFPAQGDDGFRP